MKHQHSAPASPRCEPCTDPSHIFLLLSQPCPPPYPITSPGTSVSLPDSFPLFCCPQIPGCFGGAPGKQRQFGGPTCTEAGMQGRWSSTRGWEAGKQCASGEFPSVQLSPCWALSSSSRILRPMDCLTFIGIPFPC